MSSSQKGKKLTPQEEQKRREILMRMEMEALGPARIEKLKTTDYRTRKPYVPFATLRLRRLDALAKNGSLSSDEVTKLKAWRSLPSANGDTTSKLTPQQEAKRQTIMYMEMEALNPKRIERISTTDFLDPSPYVPFATLRLRDLDELEKEGALTSEEVVMVKEWRSAAAKAAAMWDKVERR